MSGGYDIAVADVEVVGERTNKVPTGPYRGAGRPEAASSRVHRRRRGARARIDPLELRRRNLIRSFPYETALGWTYDSGTTSGASTWRRSWWAEHRSAGCVGVGTFGLYVERAGGLFETPR